MSVPFQATHTAEDGRYYMVDGCEWFYANAFGHWKRHWSGAPVGLKEIKKSKQWAGPQDGLPPVGTVCEIKNERHGRTDKKWITCEIIFSSKYYVIVKSSELIGQEEAVCVPSDLRFRSKDHRETAIREIMDIADVDCRVTAARLVDAGFKREVV